MVAKWSPLDPDILYEIKVDNNHDAIEDVEHAARPVEALRIGQMESARRQDVQTLSAWAWALHANGRTQEAREVMARALAVGTKDPEIRARADTLGVTP